MLNTAVLCCGEPGSVKRSSPVVTAVSRLKDITGTQSSDTERCHGGGGSGRPVNQPPAAAAATVTAAHRRPTVRRRPCHPDRCSAGTTHTSSTVTVYSASRT